MTRQGLAYRLITAFIQEHSWVWCASAIQHSVPARLLKSDSSEVLRYFSLAGINEVTAGRHEDSHESDCALLSH